MRVAKFCRRNVSRGLSREAVRRLKKIHRKEVGVQIVDCCRRCLACRVQPFCRIQLTTIEAPDSDTLVQRILEAVRKANEGTSQDTRP
ncbi:DUF1450 domain-containing protein [Alicyclobacillus fastidiosus]|uniref:DUF1450 domain-containing protein n=1 Tax=Alicyclobacillus fastidiosus TaxID=392011 RepID=A0ABY6ZMF2_9BACL|nr:DUF1450 domain-containing protein [Alicyclobacillus fastidiosus]WAH43145.1 DUF1450 domain-containing protein [Alicyclobacillus fastidiosus]GMA65158.1 hypothetical protein GCM10025859_55980 [Alicyclobacillus fastidiosus]